MERLACLATLAASLSLAAPAAQAQWTQDTLSDPRRGVVAVTLDGKAYFAGGLNASFVSRDTIDIWDEVAGTWSAPAHLSVARSDFDATVVGPYAMFAGGAVNGTTETANVDVFDSQTQTWSVVALSQARFSLAATTVGTKALFAGGATGGIANPGAVPSAVVDVYDSALGAPSDPLAWTTHSISVPRGAMAATTVGTKAIFAGGFDGVAGLATVDVYDAALGAPNDPLAWSAYHVSTARLIGKQGATTSGTRAYFAGGQLDAAGTGSSRVDVYDAALGAPTDALAWSTLELSVPRTDVAATSVGDTVLFAGGRGPGAVSAVVDVLDASTGSWLPTTYLSLARNYIGATTVGDRAFFAGGVQAGAVTTQVDIYEVPQPTPFCFGDGSGTACPCDNSGAAGNGCANSIFAAGANLAVNGASSLVGDSLVLSGTGMPNSAALYFQGSTWTVGGLGVAFGDGLRCAGGSIVRLGTKTNVGGASQFPTAGDPSVSVRGLVNAAGTRIYQIWYRNAAAFCTASTFNLSQGMTVTWN